MKISRFREITNKHEQKQPNMTTQNNKINEVLFRSLLEYCFKMCQVGDEQKVSDIGMPCKLQHVT